ncbi:uro-adherence factor A isoform X1 [Paralichthys olivaceus]|uniref:uro-adherence factor A isoform X1 n=1 Tax=Paralichthys olivaceus TaxID=8255 RepID=UPI003752B5EB
MDPDSNAISRVERTLWTVWNYITGAVNRFLHPEPIVTEDNEHDSFQQSAADGEPADSHHPDGDSGGQGVDEELPRATTSLLSLSRAVVAWEQEESMQYRSQLSGAPESKASEEGENTKEEQFSQTGTDGARLVKAVKEDKEVEDGDQISYTHGQDDTTENEGALNITDDDMSEELRGSGRKVGAEEEAQDDHGKMDEKGEDDKTHYEEEPTLEMEDAETTLCGMADFSSEEERNVEEARVQRDAAEEGENRDGVSQLGLENKNNSDVRRKQVEHQLHVCEELSENNREVKGGPGSSWLDDEVNLTLGKSGKVSEDVGHEHVMGELGGEENEAEDHQAIDEEIFTEHVACNEVVQNAEAELQTAGFKVKEKEDVAKDTKEQTTTPESEGVIEESNVTTTEVSVEERFPDKDQTEVESFSIKVKDNKESHMEPAYTTALVTVKPKGQTGQEISGAFENIPPGLCEGRAVVLEELHSPTSKGTQEGVPEYNNEPGPDENTTQRFLEVGNYKEIVATRLPEEVERKESENLQNSGTGGGFSPERTEDIKKEDTMILQLTDAGLPQETEKTIVEPAFEGLGHKDETLKTRVGQLEKESETHVGATDEKTEEQDGTEELLVDFETNEGLSGTKDAAGGDGETMRAATDRTLKSLKAKEPRTTEMSFHRVSGDAEQNRIRTLGLEDIIRSGFTKQSAEPKLPEGRSVEMQDAGIDMDETSSGAEEQEIEDEVQNKNEMGTLNLAAELTSENNKNIWFAESELSRPDESLESKNQPSDEASEASNEDPAAADKVMTTKGKPKDLDVIATKEMEKLVTESEKSSVSGCQDLNDEEILDLWIETASFKDADCMERGEGPEPGRQLAKTEEQSDETEEEMPWLQTEENEKLVESTSGESGLVSDTEMSPSAAESGLLDQSLSEWSTDHSESLLLETTSSGSLQDFCDLLAGAESADVSELSTRQPDSECQDVSMEEAAKTGQLDLEEVESSAETGFLPESGMISLEAGCLKVRSDKSQDKTDEERVESAENETGKQKEIDWNDSGEEDPDILYTDEKTEDADAHREAAVSDTLDATKRAESGRAGSRSEVLLQDEITLTESEDVPCAETLEQPQDTVWSEDIAEVTEEQTKAQVDASTLDFTAQRSRIAVKNPRVRPPKDPRSLLHMPSADPMPSSRLPVKVPAGVPLGRMGIGIKLPGIGAGFPALKKTQRVMTEEKSSETFSQEPETKPEEKSDTIKQDEEKHKPKWKPPRHPGFGNPLMSELKNKLRKPTNE